MLRWAIIFLLIALVAAVIGFGGTAGAAISIAKILFIILLVLLLVMLVLGRRHVQADGPCQRCAARRPVGASVLPATHQRSIVETVTVVAVRSSDSWDRREE
jgi:uncharacterized membrane protein YtjA (UPF0391 family)